MTTIRATCPGCGEVEMGAEAIVLVLPDGQEEGTYRFLCPGCDSQVEKRADRKVVMLLLSAGVGVEGPSEALGPGPPPLTTDDLIDFHFFLQRDDWFDQLLAGSR